MLLLNSQRIFNLERMETVRVYLLPSGTSWIRLLNFHCRSHAQITTVDYCTTPSLLRIVRLVLTLIPNYFRFIFLVFTILSCLVRFLNKGTRLKYYKEFITNFRFAFFLGCVVKLLILVSPRKLTGNYYYPVMFDTFFYK